VGAPRGVLAPPVLDDPPRLLRRREPGLDGVLAPEPPVEALGEGVVRRLAGPGELELHAVAVSLGIQRLGDELGTVVDGDPLRSSEAPLEPIQDRHHPLLGQGGADRDRRADPAHAIDDRQVPEAAPVGEGAGQDVEAPPLPRAPDQRNALARPVFESVGIAGWRIVAVGPQPDFAPFFLALAEKRVTSMTRKTASPRRRGNRGV
jgi:hypothetical protein